MSSISPPNPTVAPGGSVTFTVTAFSNTPVTYQWLKDGTLRQTTTAPAGSTSASLALTNITTSDAGVYVVRVSNSAGSVTSSNATLTVTGSGPPPPLINSVSPNPVTGSNNQQPFTINGNNFASTATVTLRDLTTGEIFPNRPIASQNITQIVINPIFTTAAHAWSVQVLNPNGNASAQFNFDVLAPASAPTITSQPQSQTVTAGASVTFSVAASGAAPLSYQWRKDGGNLAGSTNPSFTITSVQPIHAGNYTVVVSNAGGNTTSQVAVLTVTAPDTPPTISRISAQTTGRDQTISGIAFTVADTETPAAALVVTASSANPTLVPNGNMVLGGSGSDRTMTITPATGQIGQAPITVTVTDGVGNRTSTGFVLTVTNLANSFVFVTTLAGTGSVGSEDGPGKSARFSTPNAGFVTPDRMSYIADSGNHRIRLLDLARREVSTVAGDGLARYGDGPALKAFFNIPLGIAVNAAGEIFVADAQNHCIRKIGRDTARTVTTVAGVGTKSGFADGPAAAAQFNFPNELVFDSAGNLFVLEFNNHTIRKITPGGTVSTLAGDGKPGTADGAGSSAQFNNPSGLAIDKADNLYVTEWQSHRIRKVTPNGVVKTFAGSLTPGFTDGLGSAAQFNVPDGIVTDPAGNLYVTEFGNHAIRKVTPDGNVTTIAGTGKPGLVDGDKSVAQFNGPGGIGWDSNGNLIVADSGNHSIRQVRLLPTPQIVAPPQSQTVAFGGSVKFEVTVEGAAPFSFQWLFNGTAMPGETKASLALDSVKFSDAGPYSVVVANSAGSVTSQPAALSVIKADPIITWAEPAAITYGMVLGDAQLNATANVAGTFRYSPGPGMLLNAGAQSLTVIFSPAEPGNYNPANAKVTLTVNKATPTINWNKPADITAGTALSNVQLNASARFAGQMIAGQYTYSPPAGTVLPAGDNQILGVFFVPDDAANFTFANGSTSINVRTPLPVITVQPVGASITAGSGVAFSVTATGATGYQWQKDGANISGATFASFALNNATTNNAGGYRVVVSNSAGSVTSQIAALIVTKADPIITWANPAAITYGTGLGAAQLNAAANIAGSFGYSPPSGTTLNAGIQSLSVTFTPTDTANYNPANAKVVLTVNKGMPAVSWPPPGPLIYGTGLSGAQLNASANVPGTFAYSPATGTVLNAGTQNLSATFTPADVGNYNPVTASNVINIAKATPALTWNKPGDITAGTALGSVQLNATANVPGEFVYTPSAGTVLSVGDNQILTAAFVPADGTNYTNTTSTVAINVKSASLPSITTQPSSTTVNLGATVTFSVTATGATSYQWQKDGLNIPGATGASVTVNNVTASDAGTYTAVVSNTAGSLTSAGAVLSIFSPPAILTQPQSQTAIAAGSVTFSVLASGTLPLSYQWRKDGVGIQEATNRNLVLTNLSAVDAGAYSVLVSNVAGSVSSAPAVLTVTSPPTITSQPQSQTVNAGATVTFTVATAGSLPFSYQWMRNGTSILGATGSQFTLNAVSAGDAGDYTVVVANAAGSVTSTPATLRVASSTLTLRLEAIGLSAGGFQLQVTSSAISSYVIQTSADLVTWVPIFSTNNAPGGVLQFTDSNPGNARARFYRVVTSP